MRAARMLNDAVEKYLQQSIPEARTPRVVVRIYADLTNLSRQLAKSNLIGLEKRSLGAFSAAFTRAISSFDFVDALNEEGTKFKIRGSDALASELIYTTSLTNTQSNSGSPQRTVLAVTSCMLHVTTPPTSPSSYPLVAYAIRLPLYKALAGTLTFISST
jgi:hypothetical protein